MRTGHCPYELLGLKLPTYDWWTVLRMNTKEFEQNVSIQELAA